MTPTNSFRDTGHNLVEALKNVYVALGGSLTDTFDDGTVGDIVLLPDILNAIAEVVGGASDSAPSEPDLPIK